MTDVQPRTSAIEVSEARPTIVDLVRSAAQDSATIVRGEIELAKAEMRQSAQRAGKGAGMFGAAAFLAFTAWFLLTFAAAFGLVAAGLPVWAGMLIVAVVYLLTAGLLGFLGKRELDRIKGLERTQANVQATLEEAKAAITPRTAT
jgi:ABC-type multidrug transport system fused ATPase/permease subunit